MSKQAKPPPPGDKAAPSAPPPPPTWRNWLWPIMLIVIFALFFLLPTRSPSTSLTYSQFLAQVKANNIATASISSDSATGNFKKTYVNPFADLLEPTKYRNFDSERRLAETESDGIVAEVLFPNTVPPFFEESGLVATPPTAEDYERRWAGLQAHNRWLADFCNDAPGRRAGIAQIFLNDVDDAVQEIKKVRDLGLSGGILLPGAPPNSHVLPLFSPEYEPIWQACAEYDVTINHHGGAGLPEFPLTPVGIATMLIEVPLFSHR